MVVISDPLIFLGKFMTQSSKPSHYDYKTIVYIGDYKTIAL